MSPQPTPVRPELDDIADRLMALRRLAADRDGMLVYLLDLALLHVAQIGVVSGVLPDGAMPMEHTHD